MLDTTADKLTLEEVARHDGRDGSYWTVVDNHVYDITEFVRDHPGGSIIRIAAGRDASVLFEQYHGPKSLGRARVALRERAHLIGRLAAQAGETVDPTFFRVVRQRVARHLHTRGLNRRGYPWRTIVELAIVMLVFVAAWVWRVAEGSYLAAIVCGVMLGRLGFLMHSGNHAASFGNRVGNRVLGLLMDFAGGSSRVWTVDHQVSHHLHPNVHGRDNDCAIGSPLLRFHPKLRRRTWHRYQHIVTFVGMSIGLIKWLVSDIVDHATGHAGVTRFHVTPGDWARLLAFKLNWMCIHIVIPGLVVGWGTALGTAFVMMAAGAYYVESIFIVNHIQPGLVPPHKEHWAMTQVRATSNWSSGSRLANAMSGGLNHQIEHHLFPAMSPHLYPEISPIVRNTCLEFGLPYANHRSFFHAWWSTFSYLRQLGRHSGVENE